MALDELHEHVARVALDAARGHGFALGGGNALIAHGIISRPTEDVDLFTDEEHGVEAASGAVQDALQGAGFRADPVDKTVGLDDVFYGMGEGLAEWVVTAPSGRQMALQMSYFERAGEPVVMEFGPVLDLEDALGGKVCALASRAYERDYADVASALDRYTPEELIGFARRLDPGLVVDDFAEAAQRLDQFSDRRLTEAGVIDPATVRERFASWPREAAGRPDPDMGADLGTGPGWAPGPEADMRPPDPQADFEAGQ